MTRFTVTADSVSKTFVPRARFVEVVTVSGRDVFLDVMSTEDARAAYVDAIAQGFAKSEALDVRIAWRATDLYVSAPCGSMVSLSRATGQAMYAAMA